MLTIAEFMAGLKQMMKLHDGKLKQIGAGYGLSLLEITVIAFLSNNPARNTAADIAEYRRLSKGNVSQAVESLIQKGLLERSQDAKDRRKVHLFLLPAAEPIVGKIHRMREEFARMIGKGISAEEMEVYQQVHRRMAENINAVCERSEEW